MSILNKQTEYVEVMLCDHRFETKPQGAEVGTVQNNMSRTKISLEKLADSLTHGASFKPAVLVGGNKAENWFQQQLFGLDFDDGTELDEAYNKFVKLGIKPCFMYTTFSHTEEHHKFRMIFCNDEVISDAAERDKLQATLMGVISGIDKVCFNRDRLFFGSNSKCVIHADYDAKINGEHIISCYWKSDFEKHISVPRVEAQSKKTKNKKSGCYIERMSDEQVDRTLIYWFFKLAIKNKYLSDDGIKYIKGIDAKTNKPNLLNLLENALPYEEFLIFMKEHKFLNSQGMEIYSRQIQRNKNVVKMEDILKKVNCV